MPFITFIYKIGNNKKIYYGKYVCCELPDDHDGLDDMIRQSVVNGINQYRKQRGFEKLRKQICIGILSFSSNEYIPVFSTDREIKCFDFYYKQHILYPDETYVNGKMVTIGV